MIKWCGEKCSCSTFLYCLEHTWIYFRCRFPASEINTDGSYLKIVLQTSGGSYISSWRGGGRGGGHSTMDARMNSHITETTFACTDETWTSDSFWAIWVTKLDKTDRDFCDIAITHRKEIWLCTSKVWIHVLLCGWIQSWRAALLPILAWHRQNETHWT